MKIFLGAKARELPFSLGRKGQKDSRALPLVEAASDKGRRQRSCPGGRRGMMDCREGGGPGADVTPALRSVPWALASRDAHLLGIKSVSLGECGFPAAQIHFHAASWPRVQLPPREGGGGWISVHLLKDGPQPHLLP